MRSGIVGEKDNLVTMHDILDAQWVYDNTKVRRASRTSKKRAGCSLLPTRANGRGLLLMSRLSTACRQSLLVQ